MSFNQDQLEQILNKHGAKIYFVGIGGIAMSAAANLAKAAGFGVVGSDSKELYDPAKSVLEDGKIKYFAGYDANHIKQSKADLYVLSAGEGPDNPEVEYIVKKNLPRVGFPELLYELNKDMLRVVVTGTHGKSTTAGLLGHLLQNLDDGSFMVGAVLQNYASNFYSGEGHYFVFEGDEYKTEFDDPTPKFHYYKPDILVLTNLEHDHPDIFPDLEALEREFALLIENMPEDGLVIYNSDDAALAKLVHKTEIASASFGFGSDADYQVTETAFDGNYARIKIKNKFSKDTLSAVAGLEEEYQTQLPGKINVMNAAAAIATLRTLGFQRDQIALDLLSFKGVKRRFETVGEKKGVTIVDDYAHHPTAVRETLEAARLRYPNARIWAVFEPHTFSRTKATLTDLAKSFGAADEVLISEIYPAREKASDAAITSQEVVEAIKSKISNLKSKIRLVHNKQEALDIIKSECHSGDVIIVMAVGSFNRLAYELMDNL